MSSPLPPQSSVAARSAADNGVARSAGQIGYMPGGGRHQAHHLYRAIGRHDQLPFSRSGPEAALKIRMSIFEILGAVQTRRLGGQTDS